MGGQVDIRPILETLKKIDKEDLPLAWDKHKERLRAEFSKNQDLAKEQVAKITAQPSILTGISSILSKLVGKGPISANNRTESAGLNSLAKSPNLVDIIENAARTERQSFLVEQEKNKAKMEELQREHEKKIREHLEMNKKKNLKLLDYLMGAGHMDVKQESASTQA